MLTLRPPWRAACIGPPYREAKVVWALEILM
jgi:hypothetical protein